MKKDYHYNEADIDRIINYIKLIDPKNATPEIAIEILEDEYVKYHDMSHDDPEIHYAIFQDIKKRKKLS
jgi:hypothetical protein